MKHLLILILYPLALILFTQCGKTNESRVNKAHVKEQIREAEAEFKEYAALHGVEDAFLAFAADSAVLNRNGRLIKGKTAIAAYFKSWPYTNVTLIWHPEFIDVSASGDMGYTYGPFQFSALDANRNPVNSEGVFHTVWKRQIDGSWKYVYD